MPSARWLKTNLISLHTVPQDFALAVKAALTRRNDPEQEMLRKQFAAEHTWTERALEFQAFLDSAGNPGTEPTVQAPASLTTGAK